MAWRVHASFNWEKNWMNETNQVIKGNIVSLLFAFNTKFIQHFRHGTYLNGLCNIVM